MFFPTRSCTQAPHSRGASVPGRVIWSPVDFARQTPMMFRWPTMSSAPWLMPVAWRYSRARPPPRVGACCNPLRTLFGRRRDSSASPRWCARCRRGDGRRRMLLAVDSSLAMLCIRSRAGSPAIWLNPLSGDPAEGEARGPGKEPAAGSRVAWHLRQTGGLRAAQRDLVRLRSLDDQDVRSDTTFGAACGLDLHVFDTGAIHCEVRLVFGPDVFRAHP